MHPLLRNAKIIIFKGMSKQQMYLLQKKPIPQGFFSQETNMGWG
jgi:hypothetical protein